MHLSGRALYAAVAAALALTTAVATADDHLTPVDGGAIADSCYGQAGGSTEGFRFCRSVQALEWMAAAECRMPLRDAPSATRPDYCAFFDGRDIREAQIATYERSWAHRALGLQRALDAGAPLTEEQIAHTHNSFNASSYVIPVDGTSPAYYPTLTNQDPNQVYSITDQLRMDIRAIEIDLHWVPSAYGDASTGGFWVTMCHGTTQATPAADVHVGCTVDRPLQSGLAEVRQWLMHNPNEFLLIYLENQLGSTTQAQDVASGLIREALGDRVLLPPAGLPQGTCADMPVEKSRADILAKGKQVLLVGNCGPGTWNQWVFTRGPQWDESGDPTNYDATRCAKDRSAHDAGPTFRRYYESSPWLEAMTGASTVITPQSTASMVQCGVNIIGFDQLQPQDGRLAALVWSWSPGEPATSSSRPACAFLGDDARWHAGTCVEHRHAACAVAAGQWQVTAATGPWWAGPRLCRAEFPAARFDVPANGYRNAQLAAARAGASDTVWLNYAAVGGRWRPHAIAG